MRLAMFRDLNAYWERLQEARVTHLVHPVWTERKLSADMKMRYTHTVLHNLALGRGPLRAVVNRGGNCGCRHGCDESECLEHFIFRCDKVRNERQLVKSVLEADVLEFSLECI